MVSLILLQNQHNLSADTGILSLKGLEMINNINVWERSSSNHLAITSRKNILWIHLLRVKVLNQYDLQSDNFSFVHR